MRLQQLILLASICTLSVPFLACSKKRDGNGIASTASVGIQTTAGIVTGREVLTVLSEALNIDYTADSNQVRSLLDDYRNFSSSLPKYGDHGTGFTSVMSRLITNFAAKSCALSAAKDNGIPFNNRVVFRFIDISRPLTDATNANPERWKAFTKHIAYRFWGEEPAADELKVINDFADSIKPLADATAPTRDAAVLVCALVGSSPRSFFKREN